MAVICREISEMLTAHYGDTDLKRITIKTKTWQSSPDYVLRSLPSPKVFIRFQTALDCLNSLRLHYIWVDDC